MKYNSKLGKGGIKPIKPIYIFSLDCILNIEMEHYFAYLLYRNMLSKQYKQYLFLFCVVSSLYLNFAVVCNYIDVHNRCRGLHLEKLFEE